MVKHKLICLMIYFTYCYSKWCTVITLKVVAPKIIN